MGLRPRGLQFLGKIVADLRHFFHNGIAFYTYIPYNGIDWLRRQAAVLPRETAGPHFVCAGRI